VTQPDARESEPSVKAEEKAPAPATKGEVRLRVFARTDVGQVREHNEDNFLVADLSRGTRGLLESNRQIALGTAGGLFAVCDGMGGAAAGEVASQLAVDILFERMMEGVDANTITHRDDLARRLVRAIEAAGLRIFHEAKADRSRRGMGTTVTGAALVDDHVFFAQVGDSRAYILRNDVLVQVTRDQSLVNQLIEAGQLTEEEAETFEHNNIILQALGTADTVQVDLTFAKVHRNDTLLLCSDGLSGMVRADEIREILRTHTDPLDACKTLTERANLAGGHDNITVIVVKFEGEGVEEVTGDTEPLKYQKYTLPEEPAETTDRRSASSAVTAAGARQRSESPQALESDGDSVVDAGWDDAAPPPQDEPEERIEIPGTHVPAWVVMVLILGVIALLGATAFVLLRG
jgi:protein phosphatase